nr:MAG TPA: LLGL2 [Caudoviricetes sp.]
MILCKSIIAGHLLPRPDFIIFSGGLQGGRM